MNAKQILPALISSFLAFGTTTATAQDSFGEDTLSKCCWAGAQPLGAVVLDASGNPGVVHVGNMVQTSTRNGTTTSIQLFDGDIQDALVYDYDWVVFPEDVSPSMAEAFQQTDGTELLGIIVRNTEEIVEIEPLGVPMAGSDGTLDLNPLGITHTRDGLALTTKTLDDTSMCCLLSDRYPITTATTDSDGYVDFSSAGSIITASAGDVQVSGSTQTYTTTSSRSR